MTEIPGGRSDLRLCEGHLRERRYAWREIWIYVDFPSPRENGGALA